MPCVSEGDQLLKRARQSGDAACGPAKRGGGFGEDGAAVATQWGVSGSGLVARLVLQSEEYLPSARDAAAAAKVCREWRALLPPTAVAARGLRDPDRRLQRMATEALAQLGGSAAPAQVRALVELLQDPGAGMAAARALGALGEHTVAHVGEALLESLSHPLLLRRVNAAEALAQLGQHAVPQLGPALVKLLGSQGSTCGAYATPSFWAERVIGHLGDHAAALVDDVATLLDDRQWQVRQVALSTLARLRKHAATQVGPVMTALADSHLEVRKQALIVLGQLGEHAVPALDAIAQQLKEEGTRATAAAAMEMLGRHIGPSHAAAMAPLVAHNDQVLRERALRCLAKKQEHVAQHVGVIVSALKDGHDGVHGAARNALLALGEHGAASHLDAIASMLQAEDSLVRMRGLDALSELGEIAAPKAHEIALRLKDEEAQVRALAVQTLGLLGQHARPHVGAVATLMRDEMDPRSEARTFLRKYKEDARLHVESIAAAVGHSNPNVCAAAILTLFDIGCAQQRIDDIAGLLKHEAPAARTLGLTALWNLRQDAVPHSGAIVALLADVHFPVRYAALQLLAMMGLHHVGDNIPGYEGRDPNVPDAEEHTSDEELREDPFGGGYSYGVEETPAQEVFPMYSTEEEDNDEERGAAAEAADKDDSRAGDGEEEHKGGEKGACLEANGSGRLASDLFLQLKEHTSPHASRIAGLCKSFHFRERKAAVQCLGWLSEHAAPHVRVIVRRLKDKNDLVRKSAVRALERMGKRALPYKDFIVPLIRDRSSLVRTQAVETLGRLNAL